MSRIMHKQSGLLYEIEALLLNVPFRSKVAFSLHGTTYTVLYCLLKVLLRYCSTCVARRKIQAADECN